MLAGIEDPVECEKFHQGFTAAWQPVGTHETECVRRLAHCYWRLRRATRFESEATIAELLAQSALRGRGSTAADRGLARGRDRRAGLTFQVKNEERLSFASTPARTTGEATDSASNLSQRQQRIVQEKALGKLCFTHLPPLTYLTKHNLVSNFVDYDH